MSARDHFVYRAYDSDGLLLYVGCTKNPRQRYLAHRRSEEERGWFGQFATHWRVTGPLSKDKARALEAAEVREHNPIFNGHSLGNTRPRVGANLLVASYFRFHAVPYPHAWKLYALGVTA